MIVRLQGGMGNQLFQYAFGRSVSLARKEELLFEKRGDMAGGSATFPYSLNLFNTDVKFAQGQRGPEYDERTAVTFDKGVYTAPKGTHFLGYWQTERYFEPNLVRAELSLRNPISEQAQCISDEILSVPNSVMIHVRRADYLTPEVAPWMGNLTMDYYTKALAGINERLHDVSFFIFSDDPEWCRHNFVFGRRLPTVVNTGRAHEDLFLMSLCKHAVLANSSFGWWGAWLGDYPGKVVIAPYRWFGNIQSQKYNPETADIIPERWIKI
jgi:hypothetical protein